MLVIRAAMAWIVRGRPARRRVEGLSAGQESQGGGFHKLIVVPLGWNDTDEPRHVGRSGRRRPLGTTEYGEVLSRPMTTSGGRRPVAAS